jgi:hypothetical protein
MDEGLLITAGDAFLPAAVKIGTQIVSQTLAVLMGAHDVQVHGFFFEVHFGANRAHMQAINFFDVFFGKHLCSLTDDAFGIVIVRASAFPQH